MHSTLVEVADFAPMCANIEIFLYSEDLDLNINC